MNFIPRWLRVLMFLRLVTQDGVGLDLPTVLLLVSAGLAAVHPGLWALLSLGVTAALWAYGQWLERESGLAAELGALKSQVTRLLNRG